MIIIRKKNHFRESLFEVQKEKNWTEDMLEAVIRSQESEDGNEPGFFYLRGTVVRPIRRNRVIAQPQELLEGSYFIQTLLAI